MTIIAETPRLVLRHWDESDIGKTDHIYSDPETMRSFGSGRTFTPDALTASLREIIKQYDDVGFANYAVVDKTSGAPIGHCGVHQGPDPERIEADWLIERRLWGRGLATEAAGALFTYAFAQHGFDRIWGYARLDNAASIAVMKKLGMSYVEEHVVHGAPHAVYVVTARDFAKRSMA